MESKSNSDTELGLLSNLSEKEEEDYFEQDNYPLENFEEEDNGIIPDENADYIFSEIRIKSKKVKPIKRLQPVEKKLENETTQRGYYKVCKEIDNKIPSYYNDNVIKNFSFLLDNQKVVEKEYGTKEDQPDGEWIIDVENVDEETLEKEINRLHVKLENVHKENKSLEKKRQNIQSRLDKARDENERLQSILEQ